MGTWQFDSSRIRIAREARDLSQQQLADRAGVTTQQVSTWEQDDCTSITTASLIKIANAMHVPPKFFFVSVDDEKSSARVSEA